MALQWNETGEVVAIMTTNKLYVYKVDDTGVHPQKDISDASNQLIENEFEILKMGFVLI